MTSSSSSVPDAAATVDGALDAVGRILRTRHRDYLEALRDGVAPLRDALDPVLEAHAEARALLPDAADEPSRQALWTAVRRYRADTMDEVWRPVRSQLEALELGTVLRDQERTLREAAGTMADAAPETITRPEPDELYAPADTDDWGTWAGKAVVRGWRRGQALVGERPTPQQTVPLADLVARYVDTELPETEAPALAAAEQRIVQWAARLEREAAAWTHRLLELERVLDRPAFHDENPPSTTEPDRGADDPTSGVMEADLEAVATEIRERAAALHRCLEDGRSLSFDAVEDAFRDAATETLNQLRTAADRSGSFMEPRWAGPGRAARSARERRRDRLDRWPDWFDEVDQRLAFLEALTALRDELVAQHRSLLEDVVGAGLTPARAAIDEGGEGLRALHDDVEDLLASSDAEDEASLPEAFEQRVREGENRLEERLLGPLRDHAPRRTTQTVVDAHREAVASVVDAQPEGFVVHDLAAPDVDRVGPGEAFSLQWRQGCREVLDEVLFEAWRTAADPLVGRAEAAGERATEVRAIVQFNLNAAVQELQDRRRADRSGESSADSFLENARELALDGLARALDLLRDAGETLDRAGVDVRRSTWRATAAAWTDLHDRVRAAGQARAHVLRARGELVRGARWLAVEAGRRVRATTTQLRRTLHRAQRQGRRLVRLGHAAVGTTPVDEAALRQTIDILSTVDTVLADLPLVYRRLFSFRPLRSEDLLVAREPDRAVVERHAERCRQGLTSPLAITGPPGSGRTSLLNVLRTTTLRSARHHSLELTERITTEAAFVTEVARALHLPHDPEADRTLESLVERIRAQPVSDRLRVCTIEQFEHVFRRTVGGTSLGARILNVLSETDTRVLWILTTTDAAWQFIETSEPAAARLVDRHALTPLDRSELEALIMARHRRSGLPLSFDGPDESTHPILARRLRSIDDEERRQELLRTEFFDRLHDVCGQNVMLALFYWFRAVHLDEDEATLRVRPLDPVSFDVLDTLPLPHAFTLKALLEHGTLTVGELAEVLGVAPTTSRALLETLGNALLIAPAERVEGPGVFQFASVDRETRYRIRPLLVHPVLRFLRSRNIVH